MSLNLPNALARHVRDFSDLVQRVFATVRNVQRASLREFVDILAGEGESDRRRIGRSYV
jgi:hypothetical protein